jgi:type II secretion system protein N
VHFFRTDRPLFDLDRLKIMPKLLSLFGSETAYRFNGSAYSGSIIGVARLPAADSTRSMTAEAEISRLELGDVPFLKQRLPLNVAGRLSGTMIMANPDDLTAELTVDDCRLELTTPLLKIDTLVFRKIEADFALTGNRLDIKRLKMNGNQLDADLVGTVMLAARSGEETLNLSGTVVPRPELLAAMGGVPKQLLAGNKRSKGRMPITITGTMERPSVAFN